MLIPNTKFETTVVITRQDAPSYNLTRALIDYNYKTLLLPVMEHKLKKIDLKQLQTITTQKQNLFIFTSFRACRYFCDQISPLKLKYIFNTNNHIAAVGPALKEYIYSLATKYNFTKPEIHVPPKNFSLEALIYHLNFLKIYVEKIWLITPKNSLISKQQLIFFKNNSSEFKRIITYETLLAKKTTNKLPVLTKKDWLTFCNPLAVKFFLQLYPTYTLTLGQNQTENKQSPPKIACLGESTKKTLETYNLKSTLLATTNSFKVLANEMANFDKNLRQSEDL